MSSLSSLDSTSSTSAYAMLYNLKPDDVNNNNNNKIMGTGSDKNTQWYNGPYHYSPTPYPYTSHITCSTTAATSTSSSSSQSSLSKENHRKSRSENRDIKSSTSRSDYDSPNRYDHKHSEYRETKNISRSSRKFSRSPSPHQRANRSGRSSRPTHRSTSRNRSESRNKYAINEICFKHNDTDNGCTKKKCTYHHVSLREEKEIIDKEIDALLNTPFYINCNPVKINALHPHIIEVQIPFPEYLIARFIGRHGIAANEFKDKFNLTYVAPVRKEERVSSSGKKEKGDLWGSIMIKGKSQHVHDAAKYILQKVFPNRIRKFLTPWFESLGISE